MKDSCTSTALVALLVLGPGCGRATEPVGDLRAAFGYEVASLDPHLDNSFEASEQVSNIYEPLVDLFIVDRSLVFERRHDLRPRYAEIGRSEGQAPDAEVLRPLGGGRR